MHKKHPHIRIIHRTVKVYWPMLLGFNEWLLGGATVFTLHFLDVVMFARYIYIYVPLPSLRIACSLQTPPNYIVMAIPTKIVFSKPDPSKKHLRFTDTFAMFSWLWNSWILGVRGWSFPKSSPLGGQRKYVPLFWWFFETRVIWVPGVYRICRHIISWSAFFSDVPSSQIVWSFQELLQCLQLMI